MKRVQKNVLGFLLAIVLVVVGSPISVHAEEAVQQMEIQKNVSDAAKRTPVYKGLYDFEVPGGVRANRITSVSLGATPRSNEILIDVSTSTNFAAKKIGVRDVYVQEKVWYGWKTIAQAADYDESTSLFSAQIHCTNAEKGKTYRILCTHYATDSSGAEYTQANQTEEFVYN